MRVAQLGGGLEARTIAKVSFLVLSHHVELTGFLWNFSQLGGFEIEGNHSCDCMRLGRWDMLPPVTLKRIMSEEKLSEWMNDTVFEVKMQNVSYNLRLLSAISGEQYKVCDAGVHESENGAASLSDIFKFKHSTLKISLGLSQFILVINKWRCELSKMWARINMFTNYGIMGNVGAVFLELELL